MPSPNTMSTKKIEWVNIKTLTKLKDNPRTITKKQFEALKRRMVADTGFFQLRPCLVSSEEGKLVIYAGNQRFEAAKSLKWKQVPCIIEEAVPEDLKKERIIADNTHHGSFDWDIIANVFSDLNLEELGLPIKEMMESLNPPLSDSEGEQEPEEPITDSFTVTFKIKVPNDISASFENQLDEFLKRFPQAVKF